MPDSRGREYGVVAGGGPDELNRKPANTIEETNDLGREYAEPKMEPADPAPEPEPEVKPAKKAAKKVVAKKAAISVDK